MHDPRMLRERADALRDAMRRREALDAFGPVVDQGVVLEKQRRAVIANVERLKAERNSTSQEVARRKKAGESADELIGQGRALGESIASDEKALVEIQGRLDHVLLEIPNVTLPDVPAGGEAHNVIVKSWGTPRDSAGVRPHWEVMAALGMLDLERGAKVSGSGFVFYRGPGARLVRALMNLCMDTHARDH